MQEFPDEHRIEYNITIKSIYEQSDIANNVVVKIPVPANTASVKVISGGSGKARYEPEKSAIFWRIKKFNGDQEYTLNAHAMLTSTKSEKAW